VALAALGRIDRPECLAVLRDRAADADWGVRLTVLLALKGMTTSGASDAFKAVLASEKDARITSAIENLEPARSKW
jgi:HEAT repeat protein